MVERLFRELDMATDWIGKGNREDLTPPVRHLRETAQRMGLLRKQKGKLLTTAKGRSLRDNPVALWWHVAARLSGGATRSPDREAGLLYLLALAASTTDRAYDFVAETLAALGWRDSEHRPISAADIGWVTGHVTEVLELLGGLRRVRGRGRRVEPGAVLLARAALRVRQAPRS
ncbi:hypothetical protein [Nocardia shimofusensis]|uniref:hypothetical protein n=1 Tax=Nocardia shimofusensis TaxID=228596 RepID=UPI0012EE3193|nr:hypothetical protein [Nocardia shimofusensis]